MTLRSDGSHTDTDSPHVQVRARRAFVSRVERLAEEFADLPLALVVHTVVVCGERGDGYDLDAVCASARRELRAEHVLRAARAS